MRIVCTPKVIRRILVLASLLVVTGPGCASRSPALDEFAERQDEKVVGKAAYIQADFEFWTSIYRPTLDDLAMLRDSWVKHGNAFPESEAIGQVRTALEEPSARVLLVALFMTAYENADLKNKSLGWAVSPPPAMMTEISERDVPLRTLMPVANPWARYFLLRYSPASWDGATEVVVSNRNARVEFPVNQ